MRQIFLAVLFLASVAGSGYSQDAPPAPPATQAPAPDAVSPQPTRTPQQIMRLYDTKLTLTADQKTQLLPVIADRQQKLQDLRADTAAAPRARLKKAKEIEASSDAKINAILTPDQQKKYAEIEAEM